MNTWTISRRINLGFTALLLLTIAVGAFALWQMQNLARSLHLLADNTLPSVLTLRETAGLTRDNILTAALYGETASGEQRKELEDRIATNRTRIDELFQRYETLISDAEDRRLFEDAKRTRTAFAGIRTRYLEAVRHGNAEEHKKMFVEVLIPAYEESVEAIDANIRYNERLGTDTSTASKSAAASGVVLIRIALGTAVLLAGFLAWRIGGTTSRLLRDLAINLEQGATQTASAARQVSAASQALSSGASEQAASVEETSASLEEMSSMIRSTADNAEKAKTLAGEARAVAEAGSRTMSEMTQAMTAIDTSSAEVAKIVKNIDEIAFQTNILALNAAVEAARAGEAGAGFAVVADEVRSLAQRSAAAAKETAEKIEAAITSSRRGSDSCTRVAVSLTQIADKVSGTDALVGEIATAAREQAQGIEQINTAITQMDQVTQSNSASAEESASAAEELDAQAASLKDMVGQLRELVGGATSTTPVSAAPAMASRVAGPAASPVARPRPRTHTIPPKPLAAGQRKAIPMPGDTGTGTGSDDDNFKNF
jgi:methyl-accepting chemotaxis protein